MTEVLTTMRLEDTKTLVTSELDAYCAERIHKAAQHGTGYVVLWRSIQRVLLSGGKRFRPYMLFMAYQAYAKHTDFGVVMPAALAQELIHFAMLVHDDIIDRDFTRYGVRNIAGQYEDFYENFIKDTHEKEHMARSSAMLAGDVLISEAYRLIGTVDVPKHDVAKALEIMSQAVFDVVGGELLDTEAAFINDALGNAKNIAFYKTASYSFVSPITMGAALAGANEDEIVKLQHIAEKLGVGYQLRDDLLGIFGNEQDTGKSNTSDITEGKRTYLVEQFENLASAEQKAEFFAVFHTPTNSEALLTRARDLLYESGAKAAVEREIEEYYETALALIDSLSIEDQQKQLFYEFAHKCLMRQR